jgi:Zn finger protein HypA/HybF involved in hydrogenase expression
MRTNFFPTDCFTCHKYLPAGAGIWSGTTFCDTDCLNAYDQAIRVRIQKENDERKAYWITSIIPSYLAEANIKPATWEKALLKITAGRTTDLNEMTYDEVEKAMREIGKRAQAKETKVKREALKADGKCLRCGGAGRSDNWSATGYTCYACNGSGKSQEAVKW